MDRLNFLCKCGYDISTVSDIAISKTAPKWFALSCPDCQRIIKVEEDTTLFYIPQVRKPDVVELSSIWNCEGLDFSTTGVSLTELIAVEEDLGVKIPDLIKRQYEIKNGGWLREQLFEVEDEFWREKYHIEYSFCWLNALVEGLFSIRSWHSIEDSSWHLWDEVFNGERKDKLIIIANSVNDYIILDYTLVTGEGDPRVLFVTFDDNQVVLLAESASLFVEMLLVGLEV